MADSNDLIDFNIIESHKENIQALPSGRSAKALAQLYSPPLLQAHPSPAMSDAHAKARVEFEEELANIDEADDPLDVYDRYVKWTMDAYPSAQATPQSQLLLLLERATKTFQSSSHYKNDPRYLKIWLQYIRLFSDAPREAFVFLARHSIGEGLALYYEEFAAWLENAGRWNQAEEIYKMGLEKEARPAERLMRKFGEFERRKDARPQDAAEPSSPALPAARPALAAKLDPFASSSPAAEQQSRASAPKKSKSSKMAIFSDDDAPPRPDSGSGSRGWDSIGSLADRKKENTVEAKPWLGEKLQAGKTNGGMQKMMIFQDKSSQSTSSLPRHLSSAITSSSTHEQQCVFNPKTGRMECVFVNLEAVYPTIGDLSVEYCFEELRAKHRGWYDADWKKRKIESPAKVKQPGHIQVHQDQLVERPQRTTESKRNVPAPKKSKQRGFEIFADTIPESNTLAVQLEKTKPKGLGFEIFADPIPQTYGQAQVSPEDPPQEKGFHILEDPIADSISKRKEPDHNEIVLVESLPKTLALNDENDENTPPPPRQEVDLAKKARREERANRTRKIKMDVKHIKNETKTIQINLDSPTGPKMKRKKSGDRVEPTMTINTKEAMDEIYGIFNQPLQSQAEEINEEDDESETDDDDAYSTGNESTATGKLSAPVSEYGDETRNEIMSRQKSTDADRTNVTDWSDFTTSRHVPKEGMDNDVSASLQSTTQDVSTSYQQTDETLTTPADLENPRTQYVPVPPEDYEPPVAQFRDMSVIPNHRLPFMTPIVEQTESSLGAATIRAERDYFSAKTPSRKAGAPDVLGDDQDDLCSSPFDDVIADMAEDKRKVLQPIRTKSTKGTISLGHGTAKSQINAKKESSVAVEPVQKGPIIRDEQCNPMDPYLRQTILAQMKPPLSSFEGYHEHLGSSFGRTAEIKKYVKAQAKSKSSISQDKGSQTQTLPPMIDLPGAQGTYSIKRELGAGTFAPVYLVENSAMAALTSDSRDADDNENHAVARLGRSTRRKAHEAMKMEEPTSAWEFLMLRQTHARLGVGRAADSIVRAHEMHLFRDECYLVEELRDQGTLLDLVNIARLESGNGGGMEEMLAMFFTVELLRVTEALHAKQLIHGDLKGDNVLVRFDDPGVETDWSPTYFPSGAHGWASKGVCLIDFGRGIDLRHFTPNVAFIADWKTSEADCAEMRELRPWTYQIDYHGLAGIVHSLLFGKYMETVAEKSSGGGLGQGALKTYRIRESLKRYWQTEMWGEVFHLLLNPLAHVGAEEGGRLPIVRGMRACRERMEEWLEANCERGVGLKGMIARMEAATRERRRRNRAG